MTTPIDATRSWHDEFFVTVGQSQQAVVDAVAAWASAVKDFYARPCPVPTSDDLPKPGEVIDNAFDFAQKLLDAQRDFAHNVISAASPVMDKPASSPG